MEDHKMLFKSHSFVLSPRNHNKINRERQRVARTKKREECFQSNRHIDVSPTPMKQFPEMPKEPPQTTALNVDEENQNPQTNTAEARYENYRQRFMKWKEETKKARKQKVQEKQPPAAVFVPPKRRSLYVVIDSKAMKTAETNKLPGYQLEQPPAAKRAAGVARKHTPGTATVKSAIHTVKPTSGTAVKYAFGTVVKSALQTAGGSVKSAVGAAVKPAPAIGASVKPAPAIGTTVKTASAIGAAVKPASAIGTTVKPASTIGTTVKPNPAIGAAVKPASAIGTTVKPTPAIGAAVKHKPAIGTTVKTTVKPVQVAQPGAATIQKATAKPLPVSTPAALTRQKSIVSIKKPPLSTAKPATRLNNIMTQPFENVKPSNVARIVKPIRSGGAAGKFKTSATHKQTKSEAKSNLSTRMKLKKAAPVNNRQKLTDKVPNLKQDLLQIATEDPLPETPIDFASIENPFHAQATSTQNKLSNSGQDLLEVYRDITKLSPVSVNENPRQSQNSTVKRQLIPAEKSKEKKKFNFVRYSIPAVGLESEVAEELGLLNNSDSDKVVDEAKAMDDQETLMVTVIGDQEHTTLKPTAAVEVNTNLPQTPPQSSNSNTNYLSPFVSVSRGKVNSQTERKKRDSMYLLQDEGQDQPEVRRVLDAVKYFRVQLDNELKRLHSICDEWSSYCEENESILMETGGKDMIDAAIGQTKLLTSKKLMQFSSLIDRCEAGATGVGLRPNDGSEATKPVLAADLEGWWDMMRLQSDNVDKRFDNLTRWKDNNWQDPDEKVKPKRKTKVATKEKLKPVAKPNSKLQSFLRKAKAEQRQNQAEEEISTPKRQRVIVVRDRKSFSPARTVLRMSTGSGGRPSIAGNGLLKSALMGAAEQKSRQQTPPPPTPSRMSILKTPGTKKRDPGTRGVMFSAKKNVRRFEFAVEEGNISGEDEALGVDKLEDCEEDMSLEKSNSFQNTNNTIQAQPTPENPNILRTCQLRSRKVKIRPSSEFM